MGGGGDPRRVRSTYMGCWPLENLYDGPCEARQTDVPGCYSMSPLPPSLLRALKQFKIFVCSFVITRRWCSCSRGPTPRVFIPIKILFNYCSVSRVGVHCSYMKFVLVTSYRSLETTQIYLQKLGEKIQKKYS